MTPRSSRTQHALGVVAVLRSRSLVHIPAVVETLCDAGVGTIEFTLTTTGILDQLPELRHRLGSTARLGVGTVTTATEVTACVEAGAEFLVTPTTDAHVIRSALDAKVEIYPGGFTPTELALGAKLSGGPVKLFPASTVGPSYLTHLRGPFPNIAVMPSGGIAIDDISSWVRAGAVGISLGGPLIGDALSGGSLRDLTNRARRAVEAYSVADAEVAHG